MTTITYAYNVNQVVWTIDKTYGVRQGVVKDVTFDANVANITPPVQYNIQYIIVVSASQVLTEDKVFADLDSAIVAYQALVLSLYP